MGKIRIIGGMHRSKIVTFKDGVTGLRPTLDRVRETLFNWLGQDLSGKSCLDLFAGSGALGFEALSRHAKDVTLVEKNATVSKDLRLNREILNADNLEIIQRNAVAYLENCNKSFDVIFLDPPYHSELLKQTLGLIKNSTVLVPEGIIYIECQVKPEIMGYKVVKQSTAGALYYALLAINGE